MRWMMTPRGTRARWTVAAVVSAFATLIVVTAGASAQAYAPGGPLGWTNGLVLCEFSSAAPLVSVSSLNITDSGLTASLAAMAEIQPNGTVAESANLSAAPWTVTNLSTDDAYILEYAASVPIVPGSAGSTPVGSILISIAFELPAYSGSPDGPTDNVTVLLDVGEWASWQSGDHLLLTFAAAPSFPDAEQLSASAPSGWIVSTLATGTQQERERMGANSTALYEAPPGHLPTTVPVVPALTVASPDWATVAVAFPAEIGASLPSFTYGARVGVVLPSSVAGIPITDLAAVAAAAAAVSVVVALSARRVRARPSRLIYADDEEP